MGDMDIDEDSHPRSGRRAAYAGHAGQNGVRRLGGAAPRSEDKDMMDVAEILLGLQVGTTHEFQFSAGPVASCTDPEPPYINIDKPVLTVAGSGGARIACSHVALMVAQETEGGGGTAAATANQTCTMAL